MKRFAWVAAVVLGLAIVVPTVPAMAEGLDQSATDQLETAQGAEEQVIVQSTDVADDSDQAISGIDDTSVDEQGVAAVDETPEDESPTAAVDSSDGNVVTEEAPDQTVSGSTSEEGQALEPMDAPDDTGSDSDAVSENTAYTIAPSAPSEALVGVSNNSASSGANVALSNPNSVLGNHWRFVSRDDGLWSIVNMRANMALTVNGTPASGSNVTVVSGQGTKWVVQKNDDGTVSFIPFGYDSLRLDIAGESADAGANVRLYTARASSMQRFVLGVANALTEALANGEKLDEGVVVVNTALPGKRAIDIKSASKDNGANVQTYASNESLAQKFFLADAGNGLYTLQSAVSGKYLDVAGGKAVSGTNVQQYTGNGTLAQLWYFIKTADGLWSLRNAKSGLALSVSGASSSNGANVDVEDVNGDACQDFSVKYVNLVNKNQVLRLSPLGDSSLSVSTSGSAAVLSKTGSTADGWWRVDSASGNSITLASLFGAKKLAVSGSVVSGAGATLVSGTGTTWIVRVNDGGSLTLSPKGYLGLALDVKNGKVSVGSSLQIYKINGTNAQRFLTPYSGNLTKAASTGKPFASCLYTIKSALESKNLALDVKNASKSNGANVQIYGANGTDAQKWELEYAGSGLYHIKSLNSKLYLGRDGSTSGSNVAQYKSSDQLSQYWYLMADGDGYAICNVTTGLALDVKGGRAANGSNVQLYTPNGSAAQRWLMVDTPLIKNGTYAFSSDLTVYGMLVLDVKGASKASGANVQVYQSNGTNAQKWVLTYKGKGVYTMASKNSGLLLTVDGSSRSNGGNVVQKTNENSDFQCWTISLDNSGSYVFKNVGSGKVLDIKGGKSDNGVNVQQYSANGTKAQGWHIKTNHDPIPSGKLGKLVSRMIYYTDIVNVGYDQLTPDRWNIKNGGECDCSSLVINCLREAGFKTGDVSSHIGKVNAGEPHAGCTYTGNMSYYLTNNGWTRLSFSLSKLKPGDILLNDAYHTCVVISGSGSTALIAQASIDENYYGWGGKAGDQTGYETNIKQAYVYGHGGWDCILRYNG